MQLETRQWESKKNKGKARENIAKGENAMTDIVDKVRQGCNAIHHFFCNLSGLQHFKKSSLDPN